MHVLRNLCAIEWCRTHPKGITDAFDVHWQELQADDVQLNMRTPPPPDILLVLICKQRYQREVIVAMRCATLEHRNIIKFKGVAIAEALGACLVFPWMENGNSLQYVRTNPGVSRLRLVSCSLITRTRTPTEI